MSSTSIFGRMERAAVDLLLFSGVVVLLQLPALATQNVTLAWNASTDPTVVGYNIYYGGGSGNYTNMTSAGNATNLTVSGLVGGATYYFAATTYNSSGVQSPFSNEVFYSVPTNTVPGNQPPTLNPISDLNINENAGPQTVNLYGITSGAANENQKLTVSATSGNTSLIPNPTVHYTSANTNGTLTLTPVTNANGSALITVTVNDGSPNNNIVTRTFTVTVNPVNQLPTLNPINNLTLYENAGPQTVNLFGITSGAANENQFLTVSATSSNTGLIPNPTVNYTSPHTNGSLAFTPLTNVYGAATISVTVNDGGPSNNIVTRSFTVIVQNYNDRTAPTVQITAPTSNQQWTNGGFTVTGKASDNLAVNTVYYSLNGSAWTTATSANNWTNWTANLTLTTGTNTVRAYAADTSGNLSPTNTVKFEYVVRKPLAIQIFGLGSPNPKCGSFSPSCTNGTPLAINENYKLTANAASGFAFTNWTDGLGNPLTNRSTLSFTMVTNLSLRANFVDVTKPTLSIVTPTSNLQWTNNSYTVTGKAGDNVAVSTVYYSLNGSAWTTASTANNWTNWTANLTLTPGTNTVQAYAVDSTGNRSTTNKVTFAYKTASGSLAGLLGAVNEDNGGTFYLCFGSSTFSQNSDDTNYDNGVGNYTYKQLTPDTAQLSIAYTAPPNIAGVKMAVLLTFITNNECAFVNQSNALNTGTITVWSVPNWAPTSVNGKTSALIADGQLTAVGFGANTLTITNSDGQVTNGNYSFKQYSPMGALLTVTQPGETNYVQLLFGATNYGSYSDLSYDRSGNPPATDHGIFAFMSQAAGGNAPASLAGSEAQVTQPDGSFGMNFGIATFAQNSANTNYANGVGTYTYAKSGTNNAELSFTYTAPPTVAGSVGPVSLRFIAPNFCILTNQDAGGSNTIAAMSFWTPPTNWVPASLAGRTINTTSTAGVVDAVTFNGDGTFSQTETGSSNPGVSLGSYTFTSYGPVGDMLVLTYSSGVEAGSTSYIQTTFMGLGFGNFLVTFYDASADPPVTSAGNFTVQ